ncbi:MAG: transposase [Spirochaetota bacterium]|nr:transposase [Spirochaetota bacterium]
MNEKRGRRRFKPEEKFNIVKLVITKAKTVSEICEEYDIHPNQYYRWQKDFFEGALERFAETKVGRKSTQDERARKQAEEEIKKLNNVIAEVVKENIEIKKKHLG